MRINNSLERWRIETMIVSRLGAYSLLVTLGLAGCSDKIDPRDGEVQQPIPVGVSVAPQRSTPQTGGLNVSTQDTVVPTADVPGIMDTTRASAAASPASGAAPPRAAPAASNPPAGVPDTPSTPRPR